MFSTNNFILSTTFKEFNHWNLQNNIKITWLWNMIFYIKEGKQAKNILKRDLSRIWDQRDENGEWRRLHNEELHSLYRSPNIVRVIKSRRLRWTGHVVWMEEDRSSLKILTGKPTRKRYLRVDEKTILELIVKK